VAKQRTEREFSAGGVVVRDEAVVVIVPHRKSPEGKKVLALPKGHPDGDESAADAAAREVREETGVTAELVEKLGDIRYFYQREGVRILKLVSFFLFRYRSGSVEDHDDEIEEARWIPLEDATRELSFDGERDMAARALSRLRADR
jgi:8-oxo-dGTP pyrophosphatase MutT (NUDIX family)